MNATTLIRLRLWSRARAGSLAPTFLLAIALAAVLLVSSSVGSVEIPLANLPEALRDPTHAAHALLWNVRLPRVAGGALVGSALAISGALLQAIVRNPIADAGTLGVTASAGLVGLLAIVWRPESALLPPIAAFTGAAGAVLLLPLLGAASGRTPTALRLVLTGAALQALFFAGIAIVTFLFADRAPAFAAFTVGSLAGTSWRELAMAAPAVAIGVLAAFGSARALDALLLDDAAIASVGLAATPARVFVSATAALLASAAVGVAGLVSFVGLVAPSAVRLWLGASHARLLPAAALAGAALVVAADTLARTVAAPIELPVGALLAALGAPYFLYLLWKKLP